MKPRNEKRDAQIVALVKAGIRAADIAETYQITRQRVCYIARQHGVRRRDWGPGHPLKPGDPK